MSNDFKLREISYESDGQITYQFPPIVYAGDRAFIVTDMMDLYWHVCDGSEGTKLIQVEALAHMPDIIGGWTLVKERE